MSPKDNSFYNKDQSLPILDYLEIELNWVCNLNCRGCCDFSNLADEPQYYDLDEYERDLNRMSELFSNIVKIRLLGGEPLLNKDLTRYVMITRQIFPETNLRITTNGLLIPKLSDDKLDVIKKCDCSFDISNYPPTRKMMPEISKKLDAAGIGYDLGFPMDHFFKNLRSKPSPSPAVAFNNCIFSHCHMLMRGKLAPCSYAICTHRLNKKFGTDYPEDDHVDIYDNDLDGNEIIRLFSHPHKFCRYCGSAIMPVKWEGHTSASTARLSDWVIDDNFINSKIAPLVQKLVKPIAIRLRSLIQNRKISLNGKKNGERS